MATQSVKIPVELHLNNVKTQIDELRKALGNVKEDSNSYKVLKKSLQQLEDQFLKVQAESKKAFTNQSDITQFRKGFEKIASLANIFQERLENVNVKDLKLDSKDYDEAVKRAKDLNEEIKALSSKQIGNIFDGTEVAASAKELKIAFGDKTLFSNLSISFSREIEKISKEIEDLTKKKKEIQKDLDVRNSTNLNTNLNTGRVGVQVGEIYRKATTNEMAQGSIKIANSELFSSLGVPANLKVSGIKANSSEEYIRNATLAVQGAMEEYNESIREEAVEAEETLEIVREALDYLDGLGLRGKQNLTDEQQLHLQNLVGGDRRFKDIKVGKQFSPLYQKFKMKESALENVASTPELTWSEADIRAAATNAANNLVMDSKFNAQLFVNEVHNLIKSYGSKLTKEEIGWQEGDTEVSYYTRLKNQLIKEGTDTVKAINEIDQKIQEAQAKSARAEKAKQEVDNKEQEREREKRTKENEAKTAKDKAEAEKLKLAQKGTSMSTPYEGAVKKIGEDSAEATPKINECAAQLNKLNEQQRRLDSIQDSIRQWFGFNEVLNLSKQAFRAITSHIKELDAVMTEIAVVTDMTQKELWSQISTYSEMAQKYGATTQGVYEVSQLYYQQGLQTAEVMRLTEETLKMAKIANLEYADATDYMTVAIRGFKMEMTDAQRVVDVYSNIAAVTASDTEELAVAMSKTASSAEAVGSSFENTTAMIALMVETTREAPQNIGSAMKSIISRYGEMTSDPTKLVDSEGEEMSLNRVDKALKTVGITLKDANNQFREFDDVILELSAKWDTIDKNTQRYIATIMAGNRQQSRFLALVGNYNRLSELYEEAADSQDAATLQTLKTMDSIETKLNQFQTALQEFYTSTGLEEVFKKTIDFGTELINKINDLPKVFGKIPASALGMITAIISSIKNAATLLVAHFKVNMEKMTQAARESGEEAGKEYSAGFNKGSEKLTLKDTIQKNALKIGAGLSLAGSAINTLSMSFGNLETELGRTISGTGQLVGTAVDVVGKILTKDYIGAAISIISGVINAVDTMHESLEEKIDRLKNKTEETNNEALLKKDDYKNTKNELEKIKKLKDARHDSNEAYQEWIDYQNEIADNYPQLISHLDGEGNAILDLSNSYDILANSRKLANQAAIEAQKTNIELTEAELEQAKENQLKQQEALSDSLAGSESFYTKEVGRGIIRDFETGTEYWLEELITGFELTTTYKTGKPDDVFTNLTDEQLEFFKSYEEFVQKANPTIEDLKLLQDSLYVATEEDYKGIEDAQRVLLRTVLEKVADAIGAEYYSEDGDLLYNNEEELLKIIEGTLGLSEQETKLAQKQIEVAKKSYLSSMVQWSNAEQELLENTDFTSLLAEIPQINSVIEDYLKQQAGDQDLKEYVDSSNFDQDYQVIIEKLTTWFTGLNSKAKETFITAYSNIESYSFEDFKNLVDFNNLPEEMQKILTEQFNQQYEETQKHFFTALRNRVRETGVKGLNIYEFSNEIGSEYFDDILTMYDHYFAAFEEGNEILAQNGLKTLSSLWSAVGNLEGPLQKQVSDYLTSEEIDLTSLQGLYQAATHLENLGVDESIIDILLSLSNSIIPNLSIEWQTYLNNLSSTTEKLSESLEQASSGMDLTEATALAEKLGISLTDQDFTFSQGKFYYDNIEKINDFYFKEEENLRKALDSETQKQIDILAKEYLFRNAEEKEIYSNLEKTYKEAFNQLSEEEKKALSVNNWIDYAIQQIQWGQQEYIKAEETYFNYLTNSTYLSTKQLAKFLESVNLDAESEKALITALKTEDISQLTGEALRVYYEYQDGLTSLFEETNSSIIDSILDSIESGKDIAIDAKGFDKAVLDDLGFAYEEVQDASGAVILKIIDARNQSLESFKKKLETLGYAEDSLEYKDYVAKFISLNKEIEYEEERLKLELYNNLTNISSEQLGKYLANFSYLSEEDFVFNEKTGNFDFKSTSLNKLKNLSQEQQLTYWETLLENIKETDYDKYLAATTSLGVPSEFQYLVKDAQKELFESIISSVTSAIGGGASYEEANQLIKEYGLDLNSDFIETADGLKITQDAVLQIYNDLKVTKPLAAQIVLDNLTESIMESEEGLNDIYQVEEKIRKIDEEINNTKTSDSRKKILQDELTLAKNIRKELLAAGDAFNFMEQDLPTGMTNPLSAWEGLGQAFEVLEGEDFKAGYIDYTDLYNMISMMDEAGIDLKNVATNFNGDAVEASELMKAAAAAMVSVDGEVFVDLTKLGETFKLNAEGMKEGIADGLEVFAQSQVDLLDNQIAFLETIVAQEEIFKNIDINTDNKIDFSELLPSEITGEWSDQQLQVLHLLDGYLKDLVFTTGQTWEQLLNDPASFSSLDKASQDLVVTLLEMLNPSTDKVDWTKTDQEIENFVSSYKDEVSNVVETQASLIEKKIFIPVSTELENGPIRYNRVTYENIGAAYQQYLADQEIKTAELPEVQATASQVTVSTKDGKYVFTTPEGEELTVEELIAKLNLDDTAALETLSAVQTALDTLTLPDHVLTFLQQAVTKVKDYASAANSISQLAVDRIGKLKDNLNNIPTGTKTLKVALQVSSSGGVSVASVDGTIGAKGNVATVSLAKGNARAKGTLMGELGPELYATGGHYYVAGQNGAEFVDLPDDAIVFNHLQTRRLLENGSINGTGTAVTSEKKAVALATGNASGPAMASASDALNQLKEIRAMWQSLLNKSAKDLGKKAGGGSGGSGGGSDEENKAFLHDLERWYNLLRQIEKLEQQITYEQAKRANMQSGYKYSDSLQKELTLLKKQQAAHQKLSDLQKDYYDKRRKDLLSTDYSKVFTYDQDGLMQYVDGKDRGLDILATLNATDENGKAIYTLAEQLAYLRKVGFDTKVLETNADGTKTEDEEQMLQNFWDGVDGWMDELDSLYDSYNESMTSVQESIEAQMEIQQEYIDNQLSVEEKLLQAIIDREQAEIDRLEKEKEVLEEATSEYIEGLNNALDREKEMYEKNDTSAETSRLQRQLAILQRSGGSAAEIRSLQDQIDSRLQDAYFQEQQDQIDAIQEASNNQLEKMQEQIDIMTEALEYQKENGLLWAEVYEMMNLWTPDQMLQFIEEFTKSYKENSDLQNQENSEETQKQIEMYKSGEANKERDEAWADFYKNLSYEEEFKNKHAVGAQAAFNEAYAEGGLDEAKKAAEKYYKDNEKPDKPADNDSNTDPSTTPEDKPTVESGGSNSGKTNSEKKNTASYGYSETTKVVQEVLNALGGYGNLKVDGILGPATLNAIKEFQTSVGLTADGIAGSQTLEKLQGAAPQSLKRRVRAVRYKTGGLVDFTGPAWVDGTKSKPEAFLSASDTAMLKSKIFSNSDGSLKALVAALEEITNNTSRYSTETNSEQIIIQNAQVNIQPGTISNDYSARRAGEMALEEMVKIARKTTNRVVSR